MDKKNIEDILALTPMQEGLLFHYLKEPASLLYSGQLCLEISGRIDPTIFQEAWKVVINTNEALRTLFRWEGIKNPAQIVLKENPLRLRFYDFSSSHREKEKTIEKVKEDDRKEKFHLYQVPFRVTVCSAAENHYVLLISNHHILYDGWSNGIILEELFQAYNALISGKSPTKVVKTGLKEFVRWTRCRDVSKEENYWKKYLNGFVGPTGFLKIKKTEKKSQAVGYYQREFSPYIKDKLEVIVSARKFTLASIIYSAWGILVQKYINKDDVVFGTTVSGRSAKIKGIENLVGLFLNTLPLRVQTYPGDKVIDLLSRVNQMLSEREKYENTPLTEIKKYRRANNKEELFDFIVVVENYPVDKALMNKTHGFSVQSFSVKEMNNYDLTVEITVFEEMAIRLVYREDVFTEEEIVRICRDFMKVLEKIVTGLESRISQLEIISLEEKKQSLDDFSQSVSSPEFLGRNHRRIKIKGRWLEPAQIEVQIMVHEKIKEAVVVAKESTAGVLPGEQVEVYLYAYFIVKSHSTLPVSQLKEFLAGRLPEYMIPSCFVQIDSMPLSDNGEVDRQAFLADEGVGFNEKIAVAAVEPVTDIEKSVAGIWKDVLQLETVGIHENFFDTGGNSLNILRIVSELKKVFDRQIPLAIMFRYPTISAMAQYLEQEIKSENPGIDREKDKEDLQPGDQFGIQSSNASKELAEKKDSRTGLEIAVIGMAGRFPGAANIEQFWENLKNGVESIAFFTDDELLTHEANQVLIKNCNYVKAKGVLEDIDYFDASFFDYSAKESETMDPQVRILHECVWESLENAGYDPGTYEGRIGFYAGATNNYHWVQILSSWIDDPLQEYNAMILSGNDFLTTRVAYKINLKGPCFTVQTACSTSLVAVVIACHALLDNKCHMALAGGVTASPLKRVGYLYEEGMIFSPDGHCRAFEAKSRGIVPGEGVAIVLLKRHEDAVNDGDYIYAVVKGAAINNDGIRKVGYTAPSVDGQEEVIRTALQNASVPAESIGYIETHGTGTKLGDPVEFEALKEVFDTGKKGYCCMGSLKINLGHLDVAAGAAGFIKIVLCLKHRIIPPALHFESPNPEINFDDSPFYINPTLLEWKSGEYPRRAGVSSFGVGGTNAHVILEEAPIAKSAEPKVQSAGREYQLILLSAKTQSALDKMTQNLAGHLKRNPGIKLANVAYTLQVGRKHFEYRRFMVGAGVKPVIDALVAPGSSTLPTFKVQKENPFLVFLFPGQGAQYVNMGRELYEKEPLFQEELDRCFKILNPLMGEDLKEILYPPSPGPMSRVINQTEIAQLLIFIIAYGMARLLMKWVGKPDAMMGHSIGEYVAACLSGVLSLEDALILVKERGWLMQQMPHGSMLSVSLPEEELIPLLPADIALASVNSSSFCVISGTPGAIERFEGNLKERKCKTRRLHTSHAFHSHMMDPVIEPFEMQVSKRTLRKPCIPYISNVSGTWIRVEEALDPRYWAKHLRNTVRFANGLTELLSREMAVFLEVGPGRMLSTFVNKHIDKKPGQKAVNLLRHPLENVSEVEYLLNKLGNLWLYGRQINWSGFHGEARRQRCPLPCYPFERKHYWPENAAPAYQDRMNTKPDGMVKETADIEDWFYIPSWQRSVFPLQKHRDTRDQLQSCWVLFMDEQGIGRGLREGLGKNHRLVVVKAGDSFTRVNENEYTIDPRRANDYDALTKEIWSLSMVPERIVHLWSVTGTHGKGSDQTGESEAEVVQNILDLGFYSLFFLVRSLGQQEITGKIQMIVVTDNLQEVTGEEELCPAKAAVLGLVKIVPLEYPGINCRCIDIILPSVGESQGDRLINQLLVECSLDLSAPVCAYRGNHRWVPIFKPVPFNRVQGIGSRLKEEGVYLLTGGLGGFGFSIAMDLAKRVKARLILMGRSFFPPREEWNKWLARHEETDKISLKIKGIQEMEKHGAEVMTAVTDVSIEKQMGELIARVKKRFHKVDGVIHTAGVADYGGVMQNRTKRSIEEVFAPKLWGTLVLEQVLADMQPDFFLLCSSISNIAYHHKFGQVAYNAANEFLDAYACYKASRGGTFTISLNWPDWKEVGMAVDASLYWAKILNTDPRFLLREGISTSEGIEVFNRVLDNTYSRIMVSPGDLEHKIANGAVIFREILEKSNFTKPVHQRPELTTSYIKPRNDSEKKIAEIWQRLLGIEGVGIHDNFFELGATSLDIIQANSQLKEIFNMEIPAVTMYSYSTVHSLAEYLTRRETKEIPPVGGDENIEELNQSMDMMKQTIGKLGHRVNQDE
ncbi:MAG: SDR family oxidoreductase [Candidatus Aminicenantes bacterium]